jgi:hypothetical protein
MQSLLLSTSRLTLQARPAMRPSRCCHRNLTGSSPVAARPVAIRVALSPDETGLDQSLCLHTVGAPIVHVAAPDIGPAAISRIASTGSCSAGIVTGMAYSL